MARATSLVQHGHAVRDMIRCAQCGSPMRFNGSEFTCSRYGDAGAEDCRTPPQDGDALLRAVVNCLIGRLMNDSVTRELVEAADQEIARGFQRQTGDTSETGGLAGLAPQDPEREPAEPGASRYDEDASELPEWIQSMGPELKKAVPTASDLPFLRDPEGLTETARALGTYLDHATPAQTRHLLGLFIEEIRVGPNSLEILYLYPLPDEGNRASITSDKIELPFRDPEAG